MTTTTVGAIVEIENTAGSALPITALTKANPGVATSAGHGLANGDWVRLSVTSGMAQLDGQVCRIANITTDTFELEGIDTSSYSDWESGGGSAYEITAWYAFTSATDVDVPNASPTELNATKLIHTTTVNKYGLSGAAAGSVSVHDEPQTNALRKLRSLSNSDVVAFRATWNDGSIKGFGAVTAYSGGFSAQGNSIMTGSVPIAVQGAWGIVDYAS